MIVLRSRVKGPLGLLHIDDAGVLQLRSPKSARRRKSESTRFCSTSLDKATEALGQLCRGRGDAENIFDAMNSLWALPRLAPI